MTKPGISEIFGRLLRWLADEFHQVILHRKNVLPAKAKHFLHPNILWVSLPLHQNFGALNTNRVKFNQCLDTVAALHPEMRVLKIRKV